jgi:VanZ family protein
MGGALSYALRLNMKPSRLVSKWMPVIAWMVLIFAGSSDVLSAEHTSRFIVPFLRWFDPQISFATIVAIHLTLRKLGHFTEYAILALLLWRGLRGTFSAVNFSLLAAAAFLVAAAFAASDEFHQSFVPTRTASPRDVMIDCFGALVAITLCALWARSRTSALSLPPAERAANR